jgi:hypothetical protein
MELHAVMVKISYSQTLFTRYHRLLMYLHPAISECSCWCSAFTQSANSRSTSAHPTFLQSCDQRGTSGIVKGRPEPQVCCLSCQRLLLVGQASTLTVQNRISREKIDDVQTESYPGTCEVNETTASSQWCIFQVGLGCCILYVVRNQCFGLTFSCCPS